MSANASLKSEARLATKRAKEIGLTQAMIASALGASQSQVSRVLSGAGSRRSRLFDEVCKYVFSIDAGQSNVDESKELTSALAEVWDGTAGHARALALVIRSLGALSAGVSVVQRSRHAKHKVAK
jgi:transcriptional regulator with XRE-family HTH domain